MEDISYDMLDTGYGRDVRCNVKACGNSYMRTIIEVGFYLLRRIVRLGECYAVFPFMV